MANGDSGKLEKIINNGCDDGLITIIYFVSYPDETLSILEAGSFRDDSF